MSNDTDFERIDGLVNGLLVRRSAKEENDLCRVVRNLPGEKKLEVVEKLRGKNVRLAASVGARTHLPIEQQLTLVRHVLNDGESNSIKQLVMGLFVFRLSPKMMVRVLVELKCEYPDSVRLMAYYYMNSFKGMNCKYKNHLSELVGEACVSVSSENTTHKVR